jgi:hypothetical protein
MGDDTGMKEFPNTEVSGASVIGSVRAEKPLPKPQITQKEITSFATEILETTNALKEYGALYNNQRLMKGFNENQHVNNPALAKMQRRFNDLKGRVEKLKDKDPRLEALFNKMVRIGIDNTSKTGGLPFIQNDVIALIGRKNIIDSGPFLKHGILCVKDYAMPHPRPNNLVTETELKEMKQLREVLFNPKAGVINIKGSLHFILKTQRQLERLLTFDAGRKILGQLCAHKKGVMITSSSQSEVILENNTVYLDNRIKKLIAYENGIHVSAPIPLWLTLGHELIHMLHHYSEEMAANFKMEVPYKDLWTNGEEYKTIGDPTKPINPISENGLREKSLHPLRIYHHSAGPNLIDLKNRVTKCIESNINGDFIEILRSNQFSRQEIEDMVVQCSREWRPEIATVLLDHPASKELIKENLLLFFGAAKITGDEINVAKMVSEFREELDSYQENKEFELFIKMMGPSSNLFTDWYISNRKKKDFDFKKRQIIEATVVQCSKTWKPEIAAELLTHPSSKEIIKENLMLFFAAANAAGDETSVEKIISEFREECDFFEKSNEFEIFVNMMHSNQSIKCIIVHSYLSSEKKSEFKFTEGLILEILSSVGVNDDLFLKALNHPLAKKTLEGDVNLYHIFSNATVYKVENVLAKLLEMFPNILGKVLEMFPSDSSKLDIGALIETINKRSKNQVCDFWKNIVMQDYPRELFVRL